MHSFRSLVPRALGAITLFSLFVHSAGQHTDVCRALDDNARITVRASTVSTIITFNSKWQSEGCLCQSNIREFMVTHPTVAQVSQLRGYDNTFAAIQADLDTNGETCVFPEGVTPKCNSKQACAYEIPCEDGLSPVGEWPNQTCGCVAPKTMCGGVCSDEACPVDPQPSDLPPPEPQLSGLPPQPQPSEPPAPEPQPSDPPAPAPQPTEPPSNPPSQSNNAPPAQSGTPPLPQISAPPTPVYIPQPSHGFAHSSGIPQPSGIPNVSRRNIDAYRGYDYGLYSRSLCPPGKMACGALNGGRGAFECVDVMSDLVSCGGCAIPYDGGASNGGVPQTEGVDCSAIPFVSDVTCSAGRCVIDKCMPGFIPVRGKCIKSPRKNTRSNLFRRRR